MSERSGRVGGRSGAHRVGRYASLILAPAYWAAFRARTQDQREWLYPSGTPQVSVPGTRPARILVIGDGPAAGAGVRIHELGITGHLARCVAANSGRGAVVTAAAQPAASARGTLKGLDPATLVGYDAIVLMLATTDAFCLTPRRSWRRSMTGILDILTSADAAVFVTSAADMQLARSLSPLGRWLTGSHARMLDAETRAVCERSSTRLIRLDAASDLGARTYATWGRRIGAAVTASLDDAAKPAATRHG